MKGERILVNQTTIIYIQPDYIRKIKDIFVQSCACVEGPYV